MKTWAVLNRSYQPRQKNDLPQANHFSQNSHNNVKFINVDSVEKYGYQIKKDQPIKSKEMCRYYLLVPFCCSN